MEVMKVYERCTKCKAGLLCVTKTVDYYSRSFMKCDSCGDSYINFYMNKRWHPIKLEKRENFKLGESENMFKDFPCARDMTRGQVRWYCKNCSSEVVYDEDD